MEWWRRSRHRPGEFQRPDAELWHHEGVVPSVPRAPLGFLLTAVVTAAITGMVSHATSARAQRDPADSILERMVASYAGVDDFTARLHKSELIGEGLVTQLLEIRFRKPLDVYLRVRDGHDEGRQAFYRQGHNNNRVKVSAWLFRPSYDPTHETVMRQQHHPITHAGLSYSIETVMRNVTKARERGVALARYQGTETVAGRTTHHVALTPPLGCEPFQYTIRPGDSLWSVADAVGQDMYVILHHNPQVEKPDDLTPGQIIDVPYYYGARTDVWVDTQSHLPVRLEMLDCAQRIYERYTYHDLRTNVGLTDDDFD